MTVKSSLHNDITASRSLANKGIDVSLIERVNCAEVIFKGSLKWHTDLLM